MTKLDILNARLNRAMPIVTPLGVALGLLLGERVASYTYLGSYLFGFVTFVGALGVSYTQFKAVLKRFKAIILVLFSAHVFIPFLVYVLSNIVFRGQSDIITGFIILSAIPIAVSSFIWCTIYKGDAALALSLILLDTLLSPILTPLTIRIFSSSSVLIDQGGMILSLLMMIVIPSLLGMMVTQVHPAFAAKSVSFLAPVTKLLLVVVIIMHVGTIKEALSLRWIYVSLVLVNVAVIAISFLSVYLLARYVLRVNRASTVSMTFTGGMRNISVALVLATTYFPPLTALPVILGILIQQTSVAVIGALLFHPKRTD